ncbi:GNAT family N-acetyltransferase [Streptomyces sp. NBC_01142]|uniref:GNAT family N-acetyltransferase n=1 Tax=Streptomyces sp. NBC_01142 TaxID=2975865 RepID=UPI00225C2FAF|nr:GNAT family N-acetyltransferase [Streptomyces sp. NBC_01142]MCX4825451.1 GNAT family N-acetyltransferase [Streptomyces sp. NBC_01142]
MTVALRVDATASAPALLLRPWHEGDMASLIEVYRDPLMHRFAGTPVAGREEAVRWLEARERGWDIGDHLSFAVLEDRGERTEDRLVGNVVIKRADPAAPAAEVGYWTAAGARGRGMAARAVQAVTAWAFDTFAGSGPLDLELLHQADNPASCRVAEKCGFVFEPTLPAHPPLFPLDGHRHVRRAR